MEKGLEVFEIYKLFDVEIFHVRVRCVGVPSTRSYILYESCKFANVKNLFVKRIYTYALLPSIVSNNKCISLFEHFTIWNVPGNAKSFSWANCSIRCSLEGSVILSLFLVVSVLVRKAFFSFSFSFPFFFASHGLLFTYIRIQPTDSFLFFPWICQLRFSFEQPVTAAKSFRYTDVLRFDAVT